MVFKVKLTLVRRSIVNSRINDVLKKMRFISCLIRSGIIKIRRYICEDEEKYCDSDSSQGSSLHSKSCATSVEIRFDDE
jgi:uncharacterized beta-barrel protein YwiB (DUF1934 family)